MDEMAPEVKGAGDDVGADGDAEVLVQLAEAEADEAKAQAEAARARAEALRLRDVEPAVGEAAGPAPRWRERVRERVSWPAFAASAAAVLIAGALLASGWMLWQHRQAAAQRSADAAFLTAARNGVIALLSIDHSHAKADVQRVIDASTGSFKDDFTKNADDFIKTAEGSKAVTQGSISAAAVQLVNGDSAVVVLAAKSQVTNSSGARKDPRAFRMSVTVTPDGGQLKMSNVEFVP